MGGSRGVRTAVQTLIDICLISNRSQLGLPKRVEDTEEDFTGSSTVNVLKKTLTLIERITGNSPGSLGLHPAVFFYGPTGRHSSAMFMGTIDFFGSKLTNNDQKFFKRFTSVRRSLEDLLILHKDLIATVLQKNISSKRIPAYVGLLEEIIKRLEQEVNITESDIVSIAGLEGKLVVGSTVIKSKEFNDDTKSKVFLNVALSSALKCPICFGYLDASKSATYDHIQEKKHGGIGEDSNCQLVHPYCNSAVKNG